MTTKPDTLKVLTKAAEIAKSQVSKLDSVIAETNAVLENSTNLTSNDSGIYKEAVKAATKMVGLFAKAVEVTLPTGAFSPAKRGRPPKAKDGTEVAAKPKKAVAAPASGEAPKKRGRPPKAKAVEAAPVVEAAVTPKKRGRPPKAKVDMVTAAITTSANGETPKRRGRPPKARAETSTSAVN
jgi:hypothetical protein